jgi:hypothetical protein
MLEVITLVRAPDAAACNKAKVVSLATAAAPAVAPPAAISHNPAGCDTSGGVFVTVTFYDHDISEL